MPAPTDSDLYLRGAATLLASWEEYARGARGAALHLLPGAAAAVFPHEPERGIYNNALLDRDLDGPGRAAALDALEEAYAAAGVTRFAAWAHESDAALRAELVRRGYRLDTTTRAMGMALEDLRAPRPAIDAVPATWSEYLRLFDLPAALIAASDHAAFHVLVARVDGEGASAALAFDLDGDSGIYNVGTLAHARRRGLGTAVTVAQLHDAIARGCRTASIQATPMAERLYAAIGFRDLGRFVEYVPEPYAVKPASRPSAAVSKRATSP